MSGGLDDIFLPEGLYGPSTKDDSEPPSELVDLVFGNNPPLDSYTAIESRPIARCAQIEPIPETPQSPIAHEGGQHASFADDTWYNTTASFIMSPNSLILLA